MTPYDISVALQGNPSAKAKMVVIANTTEIGTVCSKRELKTLSLKCKKLGVLLVMDGTHLGPALVSRRMSTIDNLTLKDIYHLTDAFGSGVYMAAPLSVRYLSSGILSLPTTAPPVL
ncbi:hypothetical protein QBC35DRAFT_479434 [Podospora australis]|uniref:Uncharacterized protein n=1 Tax=Podospora australis TaxID=1536484 RepID=A0AAN6WKI1_9PEZI|nr:hypothetical protein QBC35DRAFT_479434 [Podospora australis]